MQINGFMQAKSCRKYKIYQLFKEALNNSSMNYSEHEQDKVQFYLVLHFQWLIGH